MGVWLVLGGQLERTHLPVVSVLALASFSPVTELARTMKQMMETLAASRRILAIHDEVVPVQDGPGVTTVTDEKSTRRRRPLLLRRWRLLTRKAIHKRSSTLLWDIGSGKTVAIVGRSGAGKTTIAYLMMRFWDPDRGVIELEGNRLEEFTLDDLRGHMALVAQDTYLFNEHDPREYPTRTSGRC